MKLQRIILVMGLFLVSMDALAQATVECDSLYNLPKDREVQVFVKCGNLEGYILGNRPLKHIDIVVTDVTTGRQRPHTLKDPIGPGKHYFSALPPAQVQWVIGKVPDVTMADRFDMAKNGFGVNPEEEITTADGETHKIGDLFRNLQKEMQESDISNCSYTSQPQVAEIRNCGKFCMAQAQCDIDGKTYKGAKLFCKVLHGNRCPTADMCAAADEDIPSITPASSEGGATIGGGTTGGGAIGGTGTTGGGAIGGTGTTGGGAIGGETTGSGAVQ